MKLLTPAQNIVLDLLFADELIRQHFYLTGGTALAAFYLSHRYSDDLDLFTHSVELDSVDRIVTDRLRDAGIECESERSSSNFRRYRVKGELQLDLVHDVDFRVGAPQLFEQIMVDNPKNIAVNKVTAVYGRLDPKDYVDLYFLLNAYTFDIMELLSLASHKDAAIEPFAWSRVIADAESISILPRMIKPIDIDDLKSFFRSLRKKVVKACKPASA